MAAAARAQQLVEGLRDDATRLQVRRFSAADGCAQAAPCCTLGRFEHDHCSCAALSSGRHDLAAVVTVASRRRSTFPSAPCPSCRRCAASKTV